MQKRYMNNKKNAQPVKNQEPLKKNKSNGRSLVVAISAFVAGAGLGFILGFFTSDKQEKITETESGQQQQFTEIRAGGYEFTNPLLDCENFHPSVSKNHVSLKTQLNDYVNSALQAGLAESISVYYRSLNNGPWIGINEDSFYMPASMLKVPLMIAVYKKAQYESGFMNKKIDYTRVLDPSFTQNIVDNVKIEVGKSYTVEELVEYMIMHSDNNAKELLLAQIGDEFLINVMIDLGVNIKNRDLSVDFVSPKEYSAFYRILYNSSYLSRDYSEKALKLLSKTMFSQGIPGKLPKTIKIAHKFGERGFQSTDIKQLHDCGIVYFENNPYLICIMTRGNSFDNLVGIISDISEIVYKSVNEDISSQGK